MSQLDSQTLYKLQASPFAFQKEFLKSREWQDTLKNAFKRLELMEVEGPRYFQVLKSPLPMEQRPRTDKLMVVNVGQLAQVKEMTDLVKVL